MSRRGILRHDELPDSGDPIWVEWAGSVLEALDEPRTTEQLKDWARREHFEMGRLINSLSWLDLRGLIAADRSNGHILWARVGPKTPSPPLAPMPSHCARCRGRMRPEPERVVCMTCGRSIYPPADDASDAG